jgi:tRNA U34 2-thiouridine synthase MnmA/TrmU
MNKIYKALSLISGGLDSMLATKLILNQGIYVEGVNFFSGFCGDHNFCFKNADCGSQSAKKSCDRLGIKLHVVDVFDDFKEVLLNPQHGYGANLNPCLDCKLFMIKKVRDLIEELGFDFFITGEVLGQRPKSQRSDTLPIATKLTGDLVVRPLSAKLLEPTLPEREGWIDRELLYDFSGRTRKPQIALAKKLGINEYLQPAGGCPLTDSHFCDRLKDLWATRGKRDYNLDDILLLHVGRHLRTRPDFKVVVGRNEIENKFFERFTDKWILLQPINYPGASLLVDSVASDEDLDFALSLAGYFGKGKDANKVQIEIKKPGAKEYIVEIIPAKNTDVLQDWYV